MEDYQEKEMEMELELELKLELVSNILYSDSNREEYHSILV